MTLDNLKLIISNKFSFPLGIRDIEVKLYKGKSDIEFSIDWFQKQMVSIEMKCDAPRENQAY